MKLIKPILTYLSAVMLSVSATLYVTEKNQEIESKVTPVSNISAEKDKQLENLRSNLKPVGYNNSKSNFNQELWCLKILGWHEIREGSEYAMKAVYSVVENRKNSGRYPDSYCQIMKQHKQFSFWNKGRYNLQALEPRPKNPIEVAALNRIESISLKVLTGRFNPVLPSNIMWYSTPAAKRESGLHWTNQYKVATKVGPHLFYRQGNQEI